MPTKTVCRINPGTISIAISGKCCRNCRKARVAKTCRFKGTTQYNNVNPSFKAVVPSKAWINTRLKKTWIKELPATSTG